MTDSEDEARLLADGSSGPPNAAGDAERELSGRFRGGSSVVRMEDARDEDEEGAGCLKDDVAEEAEAGWCR